MIIPFCYTSILSVHFTDKIISYTMKTEFNFGGVQNDRMGFMGGLDLQGVVDVPEVTEQQLRDEVDRCIREYGKTIGSYVIYGCSVDMYDPEAFKPGHKIGIIIDQAMKAAQ